MNHIKRSEIPDELKTDRQIEDRYGCPSCFNDNFYYRKTKTPYFKCRNCGHLFYKPKKQERPSQAKWEKIRSEILDRDKNKCAICGSESEMHVHHIDTDTTNNSPSNLITLCKECHSNKVHISPTKINIRLSQQLKDLTQFRNLDRDGKLEEKYRKIIYKPLNQLERALFMEMLEV
ncbi:MAG: HNH endonuclease [Promethearchaeia archaeon]